MLTLAALVEQTSTAPIVWNPEAGNPIVVSIVHRDRGASC
jgi:hypothetical protein